MVKEELGLRELKKQMTRETIANAALQLTLDKGLSDVTIEEIAQVAFVSPRTVSNYFSCKEEAVVTAGGNASTDLIEEFAQRPEDEAPLEALRQVVTDFVASSTPEDLRLSVQKMQLIDANPSLRPYQVAQHAHLEELLRLKIADRTGGDVDRDLYPWLAAAAAVTAATSAMRLWAKSDSSPEELTRLVQNAFALTSDGLPSPSRGDSSGRSSHVDAQPYEMNDPASG